MTFPPPTGVKSIPTTSRKLDPVALWPKVLTVSYSLLRVSNSNDFTTRDVTNDLWLAVSKSTQTLDVPLPAIWAWAVCNATEFPVETCILFPVVVIPTDSILTGTRWFSCVSTFPRDSTQSTEWCFPLQYLQITFLRSQQFFAKCPFLKQLNNVQT